MADTPPDAHDAHAQGEQDAEAARVRAELDGTRDSAVLTVFQIAEWVPAAYRQAYLDGAARVLDAAGGDASHQSTTSRLV
jgi:hypothetical protein